MKKNILTFGLISGLILGLFILSFNIFPGEHSEVVGYSAMVIAFSFIFVGIKNFRDKYNEGVVSFGKAFLIGLGISLIGSTIYVVAWMIDMHFFIPDFMDKYGAILIKEAHDKGLSEGELAKKVAEVNNIKAMYKNPVFVVLFTYLEVLPVGIVISLITALMLRRRKPKVSPRQVLAAG